ncbi:sugar phosphate isomerase/epimerase [bacterium]|nr:sugar phosphate isomerase/epimerase [bacterium]
MLALSTDSLNGYGLNRIFAFAKEAGYEGLDLYISQKLYDTQNAEYIKNLTAEYKIPIVAMQLPDPTPKRLEKAIEIAKAVNCKVIVVQPPKIFSVRQTSWLKTQVPKIRAKENISIALENAPSDMILGFIPKHAMNNVVEMKKFKHACIDTTRVASKRQDLIRIYKTLSKYLVHVHLSNVKGSKKYYLPDDGILPLESFLTKLKQDNFPGSISMKINPKYLNAGNDEKMMKHLRDMKEYYNKYFANVEV